MDFYDNDESIEDIKHINHLYKLRHYSNIFGIDTVSKELKVSKKRIDKLIHSNIHGSNEISFIKDTDENFNKSFDDLFKKEIEKENKIYQAKLKNDELIDNLTESRTTALGIGTNKIKRRLNKLSTPESKCIRLILEIEDKNILAKKYQGKYREKTYNVKHELINQLIDLYDEYQYVYGVQNSDIKLTKNIIYFELPNTDIQISWHCDLIKNVKKYEKEWDGKVNSTLTKIFDYIQNNFKEIIY